MFPLPFFHCIWKRFIGNFAIFTRCLLPWPHSMKHGPRGPALEEILVRCSIRSSTDLPENQQAQRDEERSHGVEGAGG